MVPNADPFAHHPDVVVVVQLLFDRLENDRGLRFRFLLELLPLFGAANMAPPVSAELEGHYANWLFGTQDFIVVSLSVDDEVHTISKIIALWGLFCWGEEQERAGMVYAQLVWMGGAQSLESFLEGFAILGSGDLSYWTPDRLRLLVEYIYSLRVPENLDPPSAGEIAEGRCVFEVVGCSDCYGGR